VGFLVGSKAFREVVVASWSHSEVESSNLRDSFARSAIETSSAAAIPLTVSQVGLAPPRSILDIRAP
jgi:hypothetical protein